MSRIPIRHTGQICKSRADAQYPSLASPTRRISFGVGQQRQNVEPRRGKE
ncbi:MAG: hypothetical protein R3C05_16330 [Pirellulaceae bacterium]